MEKAPTRHEVHVCRQGVLCPGTRFYAKGGPYYRLDNGTRTAMGAKGPFVFRAYYEHGSRRWVEAFDGNGVSILSLGPQCNSSVVPGLVRRPYRITKILGERTMKKDEVQVGKVYTAKVTDKLVPVRIDAESRHGGWDATNLATGKKVRIKGPQRLREEVKADGTRAVASGDTANTAKKRGKTAGKAATSPTVATGAKKGAKGTTKAKPKKAATRAKQGESKAKKASGLDAAARVLAETKEPMTCRQIVEVAFEKGYWKSGGATPWATIYSAMIREISVKGKDSRFKKVDRGRFASNG